MVAVDGKFGVDVGGVILDRGNDREDTSLFGPAYLSAKPVQGAVEAVAKLNEMFGGQVYIVSKCGQNIENKTREWMKHNKFHEQTGVGEDHLRFCRERKDKAPIAKELGLTHFVDDRLEILEYLKGIVQTRFLFRPSGNEIKLIGRGPAILVFSWKELLDWVEVQR